MYDLFDQDTARYRIRRLFLPFEYSNQQMNPKESQQPQGLARHFDSFEQSASNGRPKTPSSQVTARVTASFEFSKQSASNQNADACYSLPQFGAAVELCEAAQAGLGGAAS